PALLWLGLPAVRANATSTVALWPGSLAGAWGYRRALAGARRSWLSLLVPSLLGGALGAFLLVRLPSRVFEGAAPWLVLGSTLLFAWQLVRRGRRSRQRGRDGRGGPPADAAIATPPVATMPRALH